MIFIEHTPENEEVLYTVTSEGWPEFRGFVVNRQKPVEDDALLIEFDGFNGGAYDLTQANSAKEVIEKTIELAKMEYKISSTE